MRRALSACYGLNRSQEIIRDLIKGRSTGNNMGSYKLDIKKWFDPIIDFTNWANKIHDSYEDILLLIGLSI